MLQIRKMGEDTKHESDFLVDREKGHPVYLLILVKTPARFFVEGEWRETKEDVAVVFRPGQKHLYGALGECSVGYIDDWMHIDGSSEILPEHFPFGIPIQLHNPQQYYELFHVINSEFYGVAPHKNTVLDSLVNALLQKLLDESNTEEFPKIYYELISLREQIYGMPKKDWKVEKMADSLHVSVGYLHAIYKHFFGVSCIADVIHSRIQNACEILTATRKTVEEVGELCGYRNTEHFIRQFKKEMGVTPAKFRKEG